MCCFSKDKFIFTHGMVLSLKIDFNLCCRRDCLYLRVVSWIYHSFKKLKKFYFFILQLTQKETLIVSIFEAWKIQYLVKSYPFFCRSRRFGKRYFSCLSSGRKKKSIRTQNIYFVSCYFLLYFFSSTQQLFFNNFKLIHFFCCRKLFTRQTLILIWEKIY